MGTKVDLNRLNEFKTIENGFVAPVESTTTAAYDYPSGKHFYLNGNLYYAINDIAVGDTIVPYVSQGSTPNANCRPATATTNIASSSFNEVRAMAGSRVRNLTPFDTAINVGGATAVYDDGKLKLYGTCTATRRLLIFNTTVLTRTTTQAFARTVPKGQYYCHVDVSGYCNIATFPNGGSIQVSYSTFSASGQYWYLGLRGGIITAEKPAMIGLVVEGGNYGTSDNPTIIESYLDCIQQKADATTLVTRVENDETSAFAYSVNRFIIWNNGFYKVIAPISVGDTFEVGTNIEGTTVAEQLTALLNAQT